MPTVSTGSLVTAVRDILDIEPGRSDSYTSSSGEPQRAEYSSAPEVAELLKVLGDRFSRMWDGAWAALTSGNPDGIRQAAHSARELLIQVLSVLAPDDSFSDEDCRLHGVKKPTRRMRVKRILGNGSDSDVEWVEKTGAALDATYEWFCAAAHSRTDATSHMSFEVRHLLTSLGGLLGFVLIRRPASQMMRRQLPVTWRLSTG